MIGIRIANGEFYPIMKEGSRIRKRLVLTTVNDDQDSVKIDLYKGRGETMEDASYVGSLSIEGIELSPQGEPEIELLLGVDDEGNLNATASDGTTGEQQSLSVSLHSLDAPDEFGTPDFEMDTSGEGDLPFDDDFFGDIDAPADDDGDESFSGDEMPPYADDSGEEAETKRRFNPLFLLAFIIAGLAIAALILLLLLRSFPSEPTPPLTAQEETPAAVAEEPAPEKPEVVSDPEPVPVPVETVQEEVPEPVAELPAEPEPPAEVVSPGPRRVSYRIKRGDTLWDLSNAFYRTPWLYRKIARDNNIPNPDLIYAGNSLYIYEE